MEKQLKLQVNDEFVERLERLSRQLGSPMAAVLEEVMVPAIEVAEADAQLDEESLAAWEAHQLGGETVSKEAVDDIFAAALSRAKAVLQK